MMNPMIVEKIWKYYFFKFGLNSYHLKWFFKPIKYPKDKKWVFVLTFDIDYKEDEEALPNILKLLRKYDISASFACIGKMVESNTKPYHDIVNNGFDLINHTYSHPYHKIINPETKWNVLQFKDVLREIQRCHEIFERHLGYHATGFRAPHFERGNQISVIRALRKIGYIYDSSGYDPKSALRASLPFMIDDIVEIPCYRDVSSYYCIRNKKMSHEKWKNLIMETIRKEISFGGIASFYFDPQDFKSNLNILEEILINVKDRKDVWIATISDIAKYYLEHKSL